MKIEFNKVSEGLLTTQFPGLGGLMHEIFEESQKENSFISVPDVFTLEQSRNGGRTTQIFPGLDIKTIPEMRSPRAQTALKNIFDFKKDVFNALITKDTFLNKQKYEQVISFHTYKKNSDGENGFLPHIDYGMLAIVFTMGKDFEYSKDNGLTWNKLSDENGVNADTVIINFGRVYSTLTGLNPVLHRVTATGSIDEKHYPDISKFTIGFFHELIGPTKIPTDIPENIQGQHRENWAFLSKLQNIGEYTEGRLKATIVETDGTLRWNKDDDNGESNANLLQNIEPVTEQRMQTQNM